MKKILLFSIAIIICFVVCVCGKDENANTYTMRFYIVYENQSSEILRGENEQNQIARNYVYIMTESSNLMGLVAENCDYEVEMTAEFVREKIDYEIDEDNGDIIISITAASALSSPTPTSIKRIALPCACFKRSNSSYGGSNADSNNIDFGEPTEDTCDKVDDNTGRNTAFCLISIDLDKKIIYADCFGSKGETRPAINAGYDRIISYAPEEITTYTITNNLTNASTNNTIGIVAEGDSYFASIAADDGYGLDTITVTMSDPETGSIENITASVVDAGCV